MPPLFPEPLPPLRPQAILGTTLAKCHQHVSEEGGGGGAPALFDPQKPLKNERTGVFRYFFECDPKRYLEGQNGNVLDNVEYFLSK